MTWRGTEGAETFDFTILLSGLLTQARTEARARSPKHRTKSKSKSEAKAEHEFMTGTPLTLEKLVSRFYSCSDSLCIYGMEGAVGVEKNDFTIIDVS